MPSSNIHPQIARIPFSQYKSLTRQSRVLVLQEVVVWYNRIQPTLSSPPTHPICVWTSMHQKPMDEAKGNVGRCLAGEGCPCTCHVCSAKGECVRVFLKLVGNAQAAPANASLRRYHLVLQGTGRPSRVQQVR